MSETKPKRQLTEEQLAKLAEARKKALAVRQKQSLVKQAEKLEKKKEFDAKYNAIVGNKQETPKTEVNDRDKEPETENTIKHTKNKTKKILEPDSDESSSDSSSDEEYDASPLIAKYKQKYKNKYSSKYAPTQQQNHTNPSNPYQDAFVIAKASLKNKLNHELQKTAFNSLFG
jgi:hypothetical protein